MDKGALDLLSDIFGLIGALALVRPAWRANIVARKRSRVETVELSSEDDKLLHDLRDITVKQLDRDFSSWNRIDEGCLFLGVGLVVFSFGVKIVWAMVYGPH